VINRGVARLAELNIGHSIISRAVTVGLTATVQEMLRLMENQPGGTKRV